MEYKKSIGIIGFGEAGFEFAKSFIKNNYNVYVYDVLINSQPKKVRQKAESISVNLVKDIKELVEVSKFIFNLTSSAVSITIAKECAEYIDSNQYYIDCNSGLPEMKQMVWKSIEYHALFVDVAVMGPVPGQGIKVPMVVSGPGAKDFGVEFTHLNNKIQYIDDRPGSASVIKLSRSVFMKGTAVLLLETIALAEQNQVTEKVLDSLEETVGDDFKQLIQRFVIGTFEHAERRSKELEDIINLQNSFDLNSKMVSSTKTVLEEIVSYKESMNYNLSQCKSIKDYFPYITDLYQYKLE